MNLLLLTLLVSMQSTDLRMQADALFNDQQWTELIPVLDELIEDQPSAELYYDKGVALYEQASFELARSAFDEAMNRATDNELRAYSAYNYGNALFQETMQDLEGTSEVSGESIQAIEDAKSHIQQSLNHYRDAIQQDSSDIEARTNGEIAWHLLKQLEHMQEQMEQQQQEDANNQEQDQEEQDSSGQEQEQQDGRDNEEQDDQESEQGEQQNQSNEDGQQQDSDSEESDQQPNDQNESSDEEAESDEQQEQSQQHEGDQQEQDQQLQDGELETAEQQEELQEGEEREGQVKREGNRLSKDETNRLLQLIRDKEKERRQAIAARKAKNRKPVTKDW